MVATWLCDLLVHDLIQQGPGGSSEKTARDFLRVHKASLDFHTAQHLLGDRDCKPLLLFLCQISGDYCRVVRQLLAAGNYSEAVHV